MTVLAAITHSGGTTASALSSSPSIVGSLFRMVVALALVIAVIWIATKVLTAMRSGKIGNPRARGHQASQGLSVISRQSLGRGLQLAVVRWGDREVLVGIAGQTITFLNDLSRDQATNGTGDEGRSASVPFPLNGAFPMNSTFPAGGAFPANSPFPENGEPERDRSSLIDRLRDATARNV